MEITLNTPFNPGDVDKGKTYNKLRIAYVSIDPLLKTLQLTVEVGCYVDEAWRIGVLGRKNLLVGEGDSPSYSELMTLPTLSEETFGAALIRVLYGYVQTKFPEYAGTVE